MSKELDAEVAEKVMGWPRHQYLQHEFGTRTYPYFAVERDGVRVDFDDEEFPRLFAPSTSLTAAFEVVEKMRVDGWHFSLHSNSGPSGDLWEAEFAQSSAKSFHYFDPSPAAAICGAALLTSEQP